MQGTSQFLPFSSSDWGNQTMENKMAGECSTHGTDVKLYTFVPGIESSYAKQNAVHHGM